MIYRTPNLPILPRNGGPRRERGRRKGGRDVEGAWAIYSKVHVSTAGYGN